MSNDDVDMNITELDREWAAMAAGHDVSDEEVAEFKREYEAWIAVIESQDSPELIYCDADFVIA